MTMNQLFAVLLGVAALAALALAARSGRGAADRSRTWGWVALALSAGVQVANLLSGYSWFLSLLTTVGLLTGTWLIARGGSRTPRPL